TETGAGDFSPARRIGGAHDGDEIVRMKLGQVLPIALGALMRNKTRSFLTALGVIIGVASVISMAAVGEGAKARVAAVFSGMGTNVLIVLSGSTSSGGVMGGFG